ncbi:uncharacterized protein LOC120905218 [Anopheles arabiensis]|uniref:uncharacterized protein LOC120905218 n=1 Tax=Anopheles arabiensis TaxID=7173 RepID=UPI001AAD830E|nr:uncharacterized protein LOC120905218 [Anopheles arabiensis]
MGLPQYFNFTDNIRTHAMFVGVMLSRDAILTLIVSVAWFLEADNFPDDMKPSFKGGVFFVGIVNTLFALLYWIGYLKRKRWCMTVFIGFISVAIAIQSIGLVGAIVKLYLLTACTILTVLSINGYVLLVTLELRRTNFEPTKPQLANCV